MQKTSSDDQSLTMPSSDPVHVNISVMATVNMGPAPLGSGAPAQLNTRRQVQQLADLHHGHAQDRGWGTYMEQRA